MYLNNFYGSDNIKDSIIAKLSLDKLSHSILISAKEGYGVNYFAKLLAAQILNLSINDIQDEKSDAVTIIKGEGASNQIKVSEIRLLNKEINYSSTHNDKKIIIIQNCENFNRYSANALLKSLEEPKQDLLYILTTNDISKILPTIRSRCTVYTLSAPSKENVIEYFSKTTENDKFKHVFKVYGENIGFIKRALEDESEYECLAVSQKAYELILSKNTYDLTSLLFAYSKQKSMFLKFLTNLEIISAKEINETNANILCAINEYQKHLQINVNLNLLLENFSIAVTK